ncbi:protein peste-like isoform X2 [Euwallacea fornicatus]|uniref:protein peste-like isoform X2 n=1 Tax=Euwallacea fornicatus TaxID=995702 RepID=UPI00338DB756
MYPKKIFKKCVLFSGFLATVITFGIVIICFRNLIYKAILNKVLMLQGDGPIYNAWKKNPVPLSLKLYLFNWTNPSDILNSSVKPFFKQLGPYFFDETKEKTNVTWNDVEGTVTFRHLKRWWFNAEKSSRNLSDPVTSINPIALASAITVKNWNFVVKKALDIMMQSMSISVNSTHTAGEIMFYGYEDPILNVGNKFGFSQLPNFDKFGWFYTRNDSELYEGEFIMDTGAKGNFGELLFWKGMNSTPFYRGECGKVGGSAGEFFPNNMTKELIIKFFSPDLCRYLELEFEEEVVVNGILGYKYVAGDRFLDNGTKIKENKCFCEGACMPSGALNVSTCRYDSPAFVSLPHFLKADPHYRRIIDGMEPQKDRHEFYMIFEPRTGIPLQVAARLQVNLLLQSISGFRFLEKIPEVYVPILWFEQTVTVPESMTLYLKIFNNFEVICLALGICCIFCSIVCKICYCYKICQSIVSNRKINEKYSREEVPLTLQNTSS